MSTNQNRQNIHSAIVGMAGFVLAAYYLYQGSGVQPDSLYGFVAFACALTPVFLALAMFNNRNAAAALALIVTLTGTWVLMKAWDTTSVNNLPDSSMRTGSYTRLDFAIPQKTNWAQAYLYTKEAFEDYWKSLASGGLMTIRTSDEQLYMRTLLTLWEVLQSQPENGSDLLVQQAWGYRTAATTTQPLTFYLLLAKGQISENIVNNVHAWADKSSATPLFGPDIAPSTSYDIRLDPYSILYHPEGLMIARTALNDAAAWRLKAPVDLSPATDDKPFFSRITQLQPAWLKSLIATSLGALALVLLFPLGSMRKHDRPEAGLYPPIPAYLCYFSLIVACATSMSIAFIFLMAKFLGMGGMALAGTWAGIVTGASIVCSMLFRWGLRSIPAEMAGLRPWAWIAAGLTVPFAAAGTLWMAQDLGWEIVWLCCIGGIIALFLLYFWLRWPTRYPARIVDAGLTSI